MKTVNATYFKESGKYYTDETFEISEDLLGGTNEYWETLENNHRIKDMFMMVEDSGDDLEPYIVPHLFHPKNGGLV